tara:strand:- start:943 stop:1248 length:306 start_codon:yes stop_codon:yes gene_type:complete
MAAEKFLYFRDADTGVEPAVCYLPADKLVSLNVTGDDAIEFENVGDRTLDVDLVGDSDESAVALAITKSIVNSLPNSIVTIADDVNSEYIHESILSVTALS